MADGVDARPQMGVQAAVRLVDDATIRQASESRLGMVLADTYRIERLIAEGGMGSVYACEHVRLQQRFAVKFLETTSARDDEAYARFRQEAEIAASLDHRGIVKVFDFNTDAVGNPYIVMELVEGETLAEYIARAEPSIPIRDIMRILGPIASALDAAHSAGIVHRDLKPSNIMVRPLSGGGFEAKLLDFGICKMRDAAVGLTSANIVMGSPHYMSPEQAKGRTAAVDARTDIFALGAILYEMLTGKRTFAGTEMPELLHAIVYEQPRSILAQRPDCPAEIARAVLRCLSKDPRGRFASVRALVQALQDALKLDERRKLLPVEPAPRGADPARPGRRGRRRWIAAWAVSLAVTAGVAGLAARSTAPTAGARGIETTTIPAMRSAVAAVPPPADGFDHALATIGARMLSTGASLYRADGRGLTLWADREAAGKFRPLPSAADTTAMSPAADGDVLVGQADGTVTRWDAGLQSKRFEQRLGPEPIDALAADGQYLAAASDGTVLLVHTRTGRRLAEFGGDQPAVGLGLAGGKLIVVRPHAMEVIDVDRRRRIGSIPLVDVAVRAAMKPGRTTDLTIDFLQGDWIVRRRCKLAFGPKDGEPRLELGPAHRL